MKIKRSSENWDSGFQTTLFLSAVLNLSRPAGEGWGEGGFMSYTNSILSRPTKPPPS
ncbi:hypothetical protein NEIMUCOT_05360 [Neisseria mucosa ATCC 25996]|uniref:Uncharacterized protein n=1 Tax=Neisseria mucosa (strain ATCC 25996 / DSM 4631 / NCTC 10774 / M26) TaxID=546266 RepID=D2ZXK6_NEIM2|nr:hypothetical protein NEIMUCOT_05360 [Neisseria mucosa ATCC 25996]